MYRDSNKNIGVKTIPEVKRSVSLTAVTDTASAKSVSSASGLTSELISTKISAFLDDADNRKTWMG